MGSYFNQYYDRKMNKSGIGKAAYVQFSVRALKQYELM